MHKRNMGLSKAYSRMNVAKWYRRGVPVSEIAKELGTSETTVRNDIKKIKMMYEESIKEDYAWRIGEMVEDIREMRRELWEAWFLSKEDCVRTILSYYYEAGQKKPSGKRLVKDGRLPDVKYMNALRDLLNFEADLLSLKKVDDSAGHALINDLIQLYENRPKELSPVQQELMEARKLLMEKTGVEDADFEVINASTDTGSSD